MKTIPPHVFLTGLKARDFHNLLNMREKPNLAYKLIKKLISILIVFSDASSARCPTDSTDRIGVLSLKFLLLGSPAPSARSAWAPAICSGCPTF
jgi:hypothetical protein